MGEVTKISLVTKYFVNRYLENYRKGHTDFQQMIKMDFDL